MQFNVSSTVVLREPELQINFQIVRPLLVYMEMCRFTRVSRHSRYKNTLVGVASCCVLSDCSRGLMGFKCVKI